MILRIFGNGVKRKIGNGDEGKKREGRNGIKDKSEFGKKLI